VKKAVGPLVFAFTLDGDDKPDFMCSIGSWPRRSDWRWVWAAIRPRMRCCDSSPAVMTAVHECTWRSRAQTAAGTTSSRVLFALQKFA